MKALTKTDFKFEGQKSVYHGKEVPGRYDGYLS